jgi:hypothetical protein
MHSVTVKANVRQKFQHPALVAAAVIALVAIFLATIDIVEHGVTRRGCADEPTWLGHSFIIAGCLLP